MAETTALVEIPGAPEFSKFMGSAGGQFELQGPYRIEGFDEGIRILGAKWTVLRNGAPLGDYYRFTKLGDNGDVAGVEVVKYQGRIPDYKKRKQKIPNAIVLLASPERKDDYPEIPFP